MNKSANAFKTGPVTAAGSGQKTAGHMSVLNQAKAHLKKMETTRRDRSERRLMKETKQSTVDDRDVFS